MAFEYLGRAKKIDQDLQETNPGYKMTETKMLRIKYFMLFYELAEMKGIKHINLHSMAFLIMEEMVLFREYPSEYFMNMQILFFESIVKLSFVGIQKRNFECVEPFLMTMYKYALRYGLSMRCIQILALKIQMNMLKSDLADAENKLKCFDIFCNFTSPTIQAATVVSPALTSTNRKQNIFVTPAACEYEVVRRDAGIKPDKSFQLTPPSTVADLKKYLQQNKQSIQMQLYSFINGCHYARLFFMQGEYSSALAFFEKAQVFWPKLKEALLTSRILHLVNEFQFYSFIFNFYHCDCLIALRQHKEAVNISEIGKVKLEINKMDESVQADYALMAKMIKLSSDVEENQKKPRVKPSFKDFQKTITPIELVTPRINSRVPESKTMPKKPKNGTTKKQIPVFVDSPVVKTSRSVIKKMPSQTILTKKYTTESLSVDNIELTPKAKTKSTKPTAKLVKVSNDVKNIKQKQLKFSPSVDSPDVIVIEDDEDENGCPNTNLTHSKKKTTTKLPVTVNTPKSRESVVNTSMETPIGSYSARKAYYRTRRVAQSAKK